MLRALRVVTVQRGIDPRGYALLAFGGAGPLHAVQIAEELGIDVILCPRASGVLAALGLVVSQRRRDAQRSVLWDGDEITEGAIDQAMTELGEQARRALDQADAELHATYELRYRGQSFELAINAGASPDELREAFEAEHEERYGYRDPEQTLQLVTVRVTATTAGAEVALAQSGDEQELERRSRWARIGSEEVEIEVLRGAPPPGTRTDGPAVIELPESTVLVPGGWRADVDDTGTVRVWRDG
jgi:N-methylhydantoinase A